ncbi:MAG: hypothetical protein ACI9S8_002612 [Chlamydiales bacterium]
MEEDEVHPFDDNELPLKHNTLAPLSPSGSGTSGTSTFDSSLSSPVSSKRGTLLPLPEGEIDLEDYDDNSSISGESTDELESQSSMSSSGSPSTSPSLKRSSSSMSPLSDTSARLKGILRKSMAGARISAILNSPKVNRKVLPMTKEKVEQLKNELIEKVPGWVQLVDEICSEGQTIYEGNA